MERKMARGILNRPDIRKLARRALKGAWMMMIIIMMAIALGDYIFNVRKIELESTGYALIAVHPAGFKWDVTNGYPAGLIALIICSLIWLVISPMINYGVTCICRKRILGEKAGIGMLFQWRMLFKAIVVEIIYNLPAIVGIVSGLFAIIFGSRITGAITLVTIVVSIPLYFMWSMRFYILAEKPEMGPIAALRESCIRMKGHKMRLWVFDLSYIGWLLLGSVGSVAGLIIGSTMGLVGIVVALVAEFAALGAPMAYMRMGETVFNMNLYACGEAHTDDESADLWDDEAAPYDLNVYAQTEDSNEKKAFAMLSGHDFSMKRLEEKGLADEFKALNVPCETIDGWLKAYSGAIIEKYPEREEALVDILNFAGEYGDMELIQKLVNSMEGALATYAVPSEKILAHCLNTAKTLNAAAFGDKPDEARNMKDAVSALADSIERRLNESDPNGMWKYTMALLRAECK